MKSIHQPLLSYFTVLFLSVLFAACGGGTDAAYEKQTELRKCDTLKAAIDTVVKIVNIDIDEIRSRKEEMDSILRRLKFELSSPPEPKTASVIDTYNGISRTYKTFLEQYSEVIQETEELFYQEKTLRESVQKDRYSGKKEEFKEHWSEEMKSAEKLFGKAQAYVKNISDLEAVYQRSQMEMEKVLPSLLKPVSSDHK